MWRRACSSSPARSLPWAALILAALVRRKHSGFVAPSGNEKGPARTGPLASDDADQACRGSWFTSPKGKTHLVGAVCCCSTRRARDRDRAQEAPGLAFAISATTLAAIPTEATPA